ncbi:MAG: hypothetical protein QG663_1266 [Thermodesulfobacteriota bacterium]|nr:hypothetical protein [Thermodesulfobacteriota bacterium]
MKVCGVLLVLSMAIFFFQPLHGFADSTDQHIKNLKSDDPEVRAKAAFELGCS